MTKDYREYKDSKKPNIGRSKTIMKLKDENPDLIYYKARIDEHFDPDGRILDEFLNNGWDYVVADCGVESDIAGNKQDESYKPVVMEQKGRGNAHFVWLSKNKASWRQSEKDRVAKVRRKIEESGAGRKVERKGKELLITDPEVNENNMYNKNND